MFLGGRRFLDYFLSIHKIAAVQIFPSVEKVENNELLKKGCDRICVKVLSLFSVTSTFYLLCQ